MKRNNALIKGLAIVGSALVWAPVVAPLVFTRWGDLGTERFNFDWLIPAELFPVVAVGALLLLTATLLAHARRALTGAGMGVSAAMIVAGMVLAEVTGLASGETEPVGLPWILVTGAIAGYGAGIVVTGIAGLLLIKDLFSRRPEADSAPEVPAAPTPA